MVSVGELLIADSPQAWRDAGFTVDDDACRVGTVRIRLVGRDRGTGIVGWSLRGVADDVPAVESVDGLPTTFSTEPVAAPAVHAVGAVSIDHVVIASPDLARTTAALEALGVPARRVRDFEIGGTAMRQVFFRLGEVIVELIGDPDRTGDGPATFWGITFTVDDVDAAAQLLAPHAGRVKDAVQPGRRITTLKHRELGISVATALMSRPPERS